jgi:dsRNA-specific ribonuclease
MAKKDAAFEAYTKLYLAGLVNENLLPAREEDNLDFQAPDSRPSLIQASPAFDPWPMITRCHQDNPRIYYRTLLRVETPGEQPVYMVFLAPVLLPLIPDIVLYWNESKKYRISNSWMPGLVLDDEEIKLSKAITYKILHPIYQTRMAAERYDFIWLLLPCDSSGHPMIKGQLHEWIAAFQGHKPATELIAQGRYDLWGLVTQAGDARRYMVKAIDIGDPDSKFGALTPHLDVVRLPKRRDFLHPVAEVSNQNNAYTKTERFAATDCIVDDLPVSYTIFALLFPSILHKFHVSIIMETLRTSVLEPVSFEPASLELLTQALTSSASDGDRNYQRLEFLGDCILKFIASVHLMATNLKWTEGRLTGKKGRIVSNAFLARASLAAGLDKFVITNRFTGAKWSPKYAGDLLADSSPPPNVERSSKLVADVIESLIGASYVVGGFDKAFMCVQTLLPTEAWTPIAHAKDILYQNAHSDTTVGSLGVLETLVGHSFQKKALLLEAVTHGSYQGPYDHCSYERLEFLGDAVLDYIISSRLYAHEPPLSHSKMHGIRTAMVNASFLTFRMFETTVEEETTNKSTMQPELQSRALWQFLRATSPGLLVNRDAALKQHASAREQIITALEDDARYPWHLLSMTLPPKLLSDIVESTIGAIYIDSHGDLSACEVFVRRLGILNCLERIVRDGVDCLHPKERLGILAVDRKVQYVTVMANEEANADSKGMHRCQVKVGGENIGGVVKGLNGLTAETIAAWNAISILERANDVNMEVFDETIAEEAAFEDAKEVFGGMINDADW